MIRFLLFLCVILGSYLSAPLLFGQESLSLNTKNTAKKIYNRIAGVPASADEIDRMATLIDYGDPAGAVKIAMASSYFYNLTLKNWASEWTNVSQSARVPLNDYTATVIGIIRDDISFSKILYDDIIYVGSEFIAAGNSKEHFSLLEARRADLKSELVQKSQLEIGYSAAPAGIISSEAFAEAFFSNGTNRRAIRYLAKTFLCSDMEQLSDVSRPDHRVRQDVSRAPGGDTKTYQTKCSGCHAGMDGLAGAFAFYNFEKGQLIYNPNQVSEKYLSNSDNYPEGFVTKDDSWVNLWTEGSNRKIGWPSKTTGQGAKELGMMLASTNAFPKCMATRVFEKVCLRTPEISSDKKHIEEMAAAFSANNQFNMKNLFSEAAVRCLVP